MRAVLLSLMIPAALLAQSPDAGLRDGPHDLVLNGVRLWYRVAGTSAPTLPPVVFLHGGPGQGSYHFAALAGPAFERSLRMVYYDQRGSGRSERPWTGQYSIPILVEDIEGLRQALGVGRIALIAHSFGGTLALEYAAKYPDRVAGLVFVAGLWDAQQQGRYRCERTRAVYPDLARAGDSAGTDTQCDWFWKLPGSQREAMNNALMFPDSTVRLRLDSAVKSSGQRNTGELGSALFRAGLLQYRFTQFDRVTMPVLVIGGSYDAAAVPRGLNELTQRLPNATFVEYERSGHFVYLDETERFARDVTAFLTKVR